MLSEKNYSDVGCMDNILNMLEKQHLIFMNFSRAKFILTMVVVNMIIIILGSFLFKLFPIDISDPALSSSKNNYFYFIAIAPFIETIIFQALPIIIINAVMTYFFNDNHIRISVILFSALLFGGVHFFDYNFSPVKFIVTMMNGLVLAYVFESYSLNGKKAFFTTFYVHSLTNLVNLIPVTVLYVLA